MRKLAIKDMILGFLKDNLGITDEETILNMNTSAINNSIMQDMLSRGMISAKKPEAIERIKNGITISDLIDFLSE